MLANGFTESPDRLEAFVPRLNEYSFRQVVPLPSLEAWTNVLSYRVCPDFSPTVGMVSKFTFLIFFTLIFKINEP